MSLDKMALGCNPKPEMKMATFALGKVRCLPIRRCRPRASAAAHSATPFARFDCSDGEGIFAYPDGSKFEGQFLAGKPDGWGTFYFPGI